MRYTLLPFYLSAVFILSGILALPAQSAVFPGEEWVEIQDEEVEPMGWDYDALVKAWRYTRDSTNATGLFVVIGGKLMMDFGDVEELSYLASCRKSILAMLYGNYVENGKIDLNETLEELGVDDHQGLLPHEKKATIRDLISARSGIYHPASNGGDNQADAPKRGSQQPGEYYLYNNWDFNAAGAIFESQSGVDIFDALQKDLAGPLQFQDFKREEQKKLGDLERSKFPAYHMWLSTRDMARLGLLMLHKGKWKDKQVVPARWVEESVSVVTPSGEMNPGSLRNGEFGYGYMWWVWDGEDVPEALQGAYSARGAYGQYITVIPKLDLVVALKTNAKYRRSTRWPSYRRLLDLLIAAKP